MFPIGKKKHAIGDEKGLGNTEQKTILLYKILPIFGVQSMYEKKNNRNNNDEQSVNKNFHQIEDNFDRTCL